MLIYKDKLSGDEVLSDSFSYESLFDGVLWKVPGKWVLKGPIDVDIGANASAEGGEDEGVDDSAEKVVDIVDTFRLQEQPSFDKKGFVAFMKGWVQKITPLLDPSRATTFKAKLPDATKFLLGKVKDLQFFAGEKLEGTLVFAHYDEGAINPTFYYLADALVEEKV